MNKLLTKIVGAVLGASMAVGVGVAVSNAKSATQLKATDDPDITLTETTTGTSYSGTNFVKSGGVAASSYLKLGNGTLTSKLSYSIDSSKTISYKIKTRKYGGPSAAQAVVNLSLKNGSDEVATASFSPSSTTLSDYTGSFTIDSGDFSSVKFVVKGNGESTSDPKGVGISSIQFTAYSAASSKTSTSLTLTAADNKTQLDLSETVQLTSVVKDDGDNTVTGATVTYSSSNTSVASVSSTGLVTASSSNYGSTTITATYAGDDTYDGCSATIAIRVADPNTVLFSIGDIGSANSWSDGSAQSSLGTIGTVSVSGSGTGNNTKYYSSGNGTWRFYSSGSGQFTVSTTAGYLKKITLTTDGTHYFTSAPTNWSYSSNDNVFTTTSKTQTSVTISNGSGTSKIEQIEVLLGYAYTVSYDANGGSGTMTDSNSPYDKGSTVTVKANTFTAPTSTVFDHWDTKADDSGTDYDANDTFTINANVTLYAQWVSSGSDPYVTLTLTSASSAYKGTTVTVSAVSGNLEGDGLTWSITAGTITNQSTSNSSFSGKLASTGTVTIRATDNGGDTFDEVSVTVSAVTLSLDENALSLYPESSATLTATVNTGSVTWTSGNDSDATVAADLQDALKGVVSVPLNASVGHTVVITATSTIDDSVKATCTVTVVAFNGYTKVTSTSGLVVGDSYVVGVENSSKGAQLMGGVLGSGTSTYRASVDASSAFNSDKTKIVASSLPNTVAIVTLLSDGDGSYYFYDISNNKYLAGQSGNYVVDEDSLSDATSYSIGFSNGHMDVNLDGTTRVFAYNVGSPRFSTYASYAAYNYTMTNGSAHLILFHLSGSSVKTAVTSFANNSLKMNDPAYEGDITTANCASNYSAMKSAYAALSDAEKNVFQYSDDYSAARARLQKWAAANQETFTYGNENPFAASSGLSPLNVDNSVVTTVVIVISVLTLTTLGGYFLLRKRKEEN